MRSQADRDAVTLDIATSLLIFTAVAAAGAVLLVLVDLLFGGGALTGVLSCLVVGGASAAGVGYLLHQRRS